MQTEPGSKLIALRDAVDKGRADLAAGRFVEIDDDELDDYLAQLSVASTSAAARSRQSTSIGTATEDASSRMVTIIPFSV